MSASAQGHTTDGGVFETDIPARMDRLPWSKWHWMVVIGLGTVWILDGLEVTIVGSIASRLTEKGSGLALSDSQIGQAAAIYVTGACLGALFFGRMTDKFGRKKLFMITLGVYLVATTLSAFSNSFLFFAICRFFTGAGIGGEYAAINSAIDELIPARVRGRVDLIINGSFWVGAGLGAALSIVLLDPNVFPEDLGWRFAFGLGAILGLGILLVRRTIPESPRWLYIKGRPDEAEAIVADIERQVMESSGMKELPKPDTKIKVRQRGDITFREIAKTMWSDYRDRSFVGLALFVGQAFLFNSIFFTYALVLDKFYDVSSKDVGYYLIPFAIGNFAGPLVLGKFFDTVGRKPMIAGTYILSGVLLTVTAFLFKADVLTATTQTIAWCMIFFFASAGASAAYLTVSEIFPMETRGMAIAFFYAIGTAAGGITGPLLFGPLIESGKESNVFFGYALGAALMILGGLIHLWKGVEAAQRSLEDIATPLSAADEAAEGEEHGADAPTPARAPARPQPAFATSGTRGAGRGGRFGPGQASWSPAQLSSSRAVQDTDIGNEVEIICRALDEHGELSRRDLAVICAARYWGPGRFSSALKQATVDGRIRRLRRDRYASGSGQGVADGSADGFDSFARRG